MRKGTIFTYELKRLTLSKEYLLLLIVTLVYSFSLLRGMVMQGTNYTAPFSPWTFCAYISSVSPILLMLLLTLCARQFTVSERGAMTIIDAAPVPVFVFRTIRYAAIACAFLIVATMPLIACFTFYRLVFDYQVITGLALLALVLLLPSSLLIFGIAMILGYRKQVMVFVLLAVVLIVGVFDVSLPAFIDIIGSSVIQPLYNGAHEFEFSHAFIVGRITFVIIGMVCIIISLKMHQKEM